MVSQNGKDFSHCGQYAPCQTIGFVLSHRARDDDIIKIQGNRLSRYPEPFIINKSYPLLKNITLLGLNGSPKISAKISASTSTFLFQAAYPQSVKDITLKVQNLIFQGIGILHLTNLYTESNILLKNCHFENITSDEDIICVDGYIGLVTFQHCFFINNTALNSSRVVSITQSNTIFRNCYFLNNLSTANGSVAIIGGQSFIKNCKFENNTVTGTEMKGGAIYATSFSVIQILKCYFSFNRATANGGAIFCSGNKLLVVGSSFRHNIIEFKTDIHWLWTVGGGAISSQVTSVIEISSSKFIGNEAYRLGGAILVDGGSYLHIQTSSFLHNSGEGGALTYYGRKLLIKGCTFTGNRDGAINVENFSGDSMNPMPNQITKLLISNSSFVNNGARTSIATSSTLGGALNVQYDNTATNIFNCTFQHNVASMGGAISHGAKEFIVKTSTFDNNSAYNSGGAIDISDAKSEITNCTFKQNKALISDGGAISYEGNQLFIGASLFLENNAVGYNSWNENNVMDGGGQGGAIYLANVQADAKEFIIKSSSFNGNNAYRSSGAIYIFSAKSKITNCTFIQNRVLNGNGGAISYIGNPLLIDDSLFLENIAMGERGQGGAVYLGTSEELESSNDPCVYSTIMNCIFKYNKAYLQGGTVMSIISVLFIRKSLFVSSSHSHAEIYHGGEFLYSMSDLTLQDVSFIDDNKNNEKATLIFHQETHPRGLQLIHFKEGVQFNCSSGKYIQLRSQIGKKELVDCSPDNSDSYSMGNIPYNDFFCFLVVSCSFCPKMSYSLSSGYLYSKNHSIVKSHKHCYNCPTGGVCENGKIRASPNSWGYIDEKEVRFSTCPFGYCCIKHECKNYDSCRNGRRGILCNQCEDGLTENLLTPDCLQLKNCKHSWFFMVVIIATIIYTLVFMYFNQVVNMVQKLLIPAFISKLMKHNYGNLSANCQYSLQVIKLTLKQKFGFSDSLPHVTNDVEIEETEEDSLEMENHIEIYTLEELQETPQSSDERTVSIFPGLLKIIIFFYQTNVLYKVYTGSKSHAFGQTIKETISIIFSLRVDGLFTHDLSWCPIDDLRPVPKAIFKSLFVFLLFTLLLFLFVILKIGRVIKLVGNESYALNQSRLLCCSLRFALIGYASITATCFSLLSCVHLGPLGNVLFIDGSIKCYTQWQLAVILIVCFWICPFPVAIYTASRLLGRNIVSTRTFIICLVFPLPAILYWLYIKIFKQSEVEEAGRDWTIRDNGIREILEIMDGPFRRSKDNNKHRLSWESVLIGRRLVLIFIKSFVLNTFVRLSLMLLCTILFSFHHISVKPFSSGILNNTETLSLLMLIVVCFLNLVPAFDYTYPSFYVHVQDLIRVQKQTESVVTLIFPYMLGLCVATLILIRIFRLLFWLGRCFMRFTTYAKQKLCSQC